MTEDEIARLVNSIAACQTQKDELDTRINKTLVQLNEGGVSFSSLSRLTGFARNTVTSRLYRGK